MLGLTGRVEMSLMSHAPSSSINSSRAPPVYRRSTTPVRSLSLRLLRRLMLLKAGASWSRVSSTMRSRKSQSGAAPPGCVSQ